MKKSCWQQESHFILKHFISCLVYIKFCLTENTCLKLFAYYQTLCKVKMQENNTMNTAEMLKNQDWKAQTYKGFCFVVLYIDKKPQSSSFSHTCMPVYQGLRQTQQGVRHYLIKRISLTAWHQPSAQSVCQHQIDMSVRQSWSLTAPPRGGTHSAIWLFFLMYFSQVLMSGLFRFTLYCSTLIILITLFLHDSTEKFLMLQDRSL